MATADRLTDGWGLAVDLGTSFTSACRFDSTGVMPLEVDGSRRIPSAVLLDRDGKLVAGEQAMRGGALDPDRIERTPKRAVGRPFILLGGHRVVVSDALAVLLELVAGEATRQAGGLPPSSLVVTHPARWGTNRRANLSEAARRAGLPAPTLVSEPVAAAWRYLNARPAGTTVAVYDLGGGTFDTAVVRAESSGPVVLGEPGGEDDLGGETFDHALFRLVLDHLEDREPGITDPLLESDERRWQRAASDLLDEVRRAKEALSTSLTTSVYFAMLDSEVEVTRGELEDLVRTDVDKTVQELARTITAAGLSPDDLDAIHLVGGSSRIPLVAHQLRQRFGELLQTYDDPKYVVVDGAAQLMLAALAPTPAMAGAEPEPLPEPKVEPQPELELEPEPEPGPEPAPRFVTSPLQDAAPTAAAPRAARQLPGWLPVAGAAAAVVAVVVVTFVATRGDGDPGADPDPGFVSSRTPSPTTPTPSDSETPESPSASATDDVDNSFKGPIGGDRAQYINDLFVYLADNDGEVALLDLLLTEVPEEDINEYDESDRPDLELIIDCEERDDVDADDGLCEEVSQWEIEVDAGPSGETGFLSTPTNRLFGIYRVGEITSGTYPARACNVTCPPDRTYSSLQLTWDSEPVGSSLYDDID